jgi:hypothetical protein
MHDALTDLYAYVLLLEAEWYRLGVRLEELAASESTTSECLRQAARSRVEMAEELAALRETIAALRAQAEVGFSPTDDGASPASLD